MIFKRIHDDEKRILDTIDTPICAKEDSLGAEEGRLVRAMSLLRLEFECNLEAFDDNTNVLSQERTQSAFEGMSDEIQDSLRANVITNQMKGSTEDRVDRSSSTVTAKSTFDFLGEAHSSSIDRVMDMFLYEYGDKDEERSIRSLLEEEKTMSSDKINNLDLSLSNSSSESGFLGIVQKILQSLNEKDSLNHDKYEGIEDIVETHYDNDEKEILLKKNTQEMTVSKQFAPDSQIQPFDDDVTGSKINITDDMNSRSKKMQNFQINTKSLDTVVEQDTGIDDDDDTVSRNLRMLADKYSYKESEHEDKYTYNESEHELKGAQNNQVLKSLKNSSDNEDSKKQKEESSILCNFVTSTACCEIGKPESGENEAECSSADLLVYSSSSDSKEESDRSSDDGQSLPSSS